MEDFSKRSSCWDEEDYGDGSYQKYVEVEGGGGEYEIVVDNEWGDASESISTASPLQVSHSYTVEVTTYPYYWDTPGLESGTLGLVFNVRDLKYTDEFYYVFRVRSDEGEAEFFKVLKRPGENQIFDAKKKTNYDIDPYNTTIRPSVNILKVIQNGNRASLFVNGVEVWGDIPIEPQDCEFLRAGLYVSADKYNKFTARFDDFKLYSIGYAPQPQLMGIQAHELKSHKGIEIRK